MTVRMLSRFPAWLKPMGRHAASLLAPVAVLGAMAAAPALAIPEAEAIKKLQVVPVFVITDANGCLLYTSPSPRDLSTSRMPSSA